jgi:DNA-binding Xre family transcriptional regulator
MDVKALIRKSLLIVLLSPYAMAKLNLGAGEKLSITFLTVPIMCIAIACNRGDELLWYSF